MIFIVVKFPVRPEHVDSFLDRVDGFTRSTRAEPGNKWFEWSRSVDEPDTFVVVEAFDDDAAAAHVQSAHFQRAMVEMKPLLARTPDIVSTQIDGVDGWGAMGELQVD